MSDVDLKELDSLSREDLIARAAALGVTRPELLTRVELRDEIVRVSETDEAQRQRTRGWFGVARDLVASVVEQRLNLPDAADLIRGVNVRMPQNVPPVATVTLAEIYAVQGHVKRAIKMLDEVLAGEPDHEAARRLRQDLVEQMNSERTARPVETAEDAESFEDVTLQDVPADADELLEPAEGTGASKAEAWPNVEPAPTNEAPVNEVAAEPTPMVDAVQVKAGSAEGTPMTVEPTASEAPANEVVEPPTPVTEVIEPEAPSADAAPVHEPPVNEVVAEAEAPSLVAATEARDTTQSSAAAIGQVPSVLVYRRTGSAVSCHWSIDERVWDECSELRNGQWIVRLVQIIPSLSLVEPVQSDLSLPGISGEAMFNDIPSQRQVRMALGWAGSDRFIPVAIGVEVAGNDMGDIHLAWSPFASPMDPTQEVLLTAARAHWRQLDAGSGT